MRHAMTDYHKQKMIIGVTDIGLNKDGIAMIQNKMNSLIQYKIEVIITSDLIRAYQTGEIIAHYLKIPVYVEKGIYERRQGVLEGMTFDDVYNKYGEINAFTKIEGRESIKVFMKRIDRAITQICEKYENNVILIVTHNNVLRTFFQMHGVRKERWELCDIIEANYHGEGRWKFDN